MQTSSASSSNDGNACSEGVSLNWTIIITGSIAHSAKRRYISYSEADFVVFRPAGATRCTDGGEIWHGGVDRQDATIRV